MLPEMGLGMVAIAVNEYGGDALVQTSMSVGGRNDCVWSPWRATGMDPPRTLTTVAVPAVQTQIG